MNIRKLFLSKRFFYCFIGSVLVLVWFIGIPFFLYLGIINEDLALNLVSEIWGLFFTLLMFVVLLECRDWLEWKSFEDTIKKRMGKQLYTLFNILGRFVYSETFKPDLSKEETLKILKSLSEMKEAKLNDYANYYLPTPKDDLSSYQLEILFRYRHYLSDYETKYFRFLKAETRSSLLEIQERLDAIEEDFRLVKRFEGSQDVVEKSMAESILRIMKEIYNLHKKMEIPIYSSRIVVES